MKAVLDLYQRIQMIHDRRLINIPDYVLFQRCQRSCFKSSDCVDSEPFLKLKCVVADQKATILISACAATAIPHLSYWIGRAKLRRHTIGNTTVLVRIRPCTIRYHRLYPCSYL